MKLGSKYIPLVLLICTDVLCTIPENLKQDFFNIYLGITLETKNITSKNVDRDNVTFHMYRIQGSPKEAVLNSTNLYLLETVKDKIVFIIHGWSSSGDAEWVLDLRDAFLIAYPNGAVITVDWKDAANELYTISSTNTYDVGNFVGDMILDLVNNHHVPISKFLLVGHSLGGQVCGFTGKKIKKNGKQLPRIIALDPAGPLYDVRPFDKRLNPSDADIVEVVHSNGGKFGFKDTCGDIDFFPNGGVLQPGCARIDLLDISSVSDAVTCNHQRSYMYFTDAVLNPSDFTAKKCSQFNILRKICDDNDTVNLGDLNTVKTGNYYFETNKDRPFSRNARGSFGLPIKISNILN